MPRTVTEALPFSIGLSLRAVAPALVALIAAAACQPTGADRVDDVAATDSPPIDRLGDALDPSPTDGGVDAVTPAEDGPVEERARDASAEPTLADDAPLDDGDGAPRDAADAPRPPDPRDGAADVADVAADVADVAADVADVAADVAPGTDVAREAAFDALDVAPSPDLPGLDRVAPDGPPDSPPDGPPDSPPGDLPGDLSGDSAADGPPDGDGAAGCSHACPAWGARCLGATLETCVVDGRGCRRAITTTCALGCAAGACLSCGAVADPARGRVGEAPMQYYLSLDVTAGTALAPWVLRSTASTWGLSAVDVRAPAAMVVRSAPRVAVTGGVGDLQRVGDRAYLLTGTGFLVYDVSDPAALRAVGTYTFPTRLTAYVLSVSGTLACVAASDGVHLVDVSVPAAPVERSVYASSSYPFGVRCVPGRMAVAGNRFIELVDVRDPRYPTFLAQATGPAMSGPLGNVFAFDGTHAYLPAPLLYSAPTTSASWYTLEAYGPRGTSQLARLGALDFLPPIRALHLAGSELYVGTNDSVGRVDVTRPAAMRWVDHVPAAGGAAAVFGQGASLFAADTALTAYDLDRAPDIELTPAAEGDAMSGSAVVGSIAYVAREVSGLVIEDLRDPRAPAVLGRVASPMMGLAANGPLLYLAARGGGATRLQVYDVSDPAAPALRGSVDVAVDGVGLLRDLVYSNGYVYGRCGLERTCAFDVRDPTRPALLGPVTFLGLPPATDLPPRALAAAGALLVMARRNDVAVFEVTDPRAPALRGVVARPSGNTGAAPRLAVVGRRAYVASACEAVITPQVCFTVVDFSDPARPVVLGTAVHRVHQNPGRYPSSTGAVVASAVRAIGQHVAVSQEHGGVVLYDVSDPASPRRVAQYWTTRPAGHTLAVDRFLRTSTGSGTSYPAAPLFVDQLTQACP